MKTRFEIHITHKKSNDQLYLRIYPLPLVTDLVEAEQALEEWINKRIKRLDKRFWTEPETSKIMLVYSVYTDEGDCQMRKLIFAVQPPARIPFNK